MKNMIRKVFFCKDISTRGVSNDPGYLQNVKQRFTYLRDFKDPKGLHTRGVEGGVGGR